MRTGVSAFVPLLCAFVLVCGGWCWALSSVVTTKPCRVLSMKMLSKSRLPNIPLLRRTDATCRGCCGALYASSSSEDKAAKRSREGARSDKARREEASVAMMVASLFAGSSAPQPFVAVRLIGQGAIGMDTTNSTAVPCAFLAPDNAPKPAEATSVKAIPLPLRNPPADLKLLSFAAHATRISKSLCLALNSILINRDDGLFDNLPYSTWSIDPYLNNRDAANNPILPKFHLGKRDAYNRFMGRDWFGRSFSLGNLVAKLHYLLDAETVQPQTQQTQTAEFDKQAAMTLATRILQLQIKEAQMNIAELEQTLAILRRANHHTTTDNDGEIQEATHNLQQAKDQSTQMQDLYSSLTANTSSNNNKKSRETLFSSLLNEIRSTQASTNRTAPYRGAIGYAPQIDTQSEMFEKSVLPYRSPYDLMVEIIHDQLHSNVIASVLENTSLFSNSVVLGGAILLQRKPRHKSTVADGEVLHMEDSMDDFGNEGIMPGDTYIVECEGDEAIGMALACNLPLSIEPYLWERLQVDVVVASTFTERSSTGSSRMDSIPLVEMVNKTIQVETQGKGIASSGTSLYVPKSTNSFLDFFAASSSSTPVFSTENPIQSVEEYDALTIQDKAQLLLSLESFKGRLPRPRSVSNKKSTSGEEVTNNGDPLDQMLLPLIDESVRRQLLIRRAERIGDLETANNLRNHKSKRQIAKENVQSALDGGLDDDIVSMYREEADLYGRLRADVTQDEGSYNRFLDKDEWYERNRLRMVKRMDKKKFGTLLDGIE